MLQQDNRKGIFKLVSECRFLDNFANAKAMTNRILSEADAEVRKLLSSSSSGKGNKGSSSSSSAKAFVKQEPNSDIFACPLERKNNRKDFSNKSEYAKAIHRI